MLMTLKKHTRIPTPNHGRSSQMKKPHFKRPPTTKKWLSAISSSLVLLLLVIVANVLAPTQSNLIQASFVDSSSLKPSIILILPQSFKVPTHQIGAETSFGNEPKLQQYVAVINNVQSDRDDQLLRQQYSKLALQVRDANSPITGQLFYEHVFDYFQRNQPFLLIPINLDQVSPIQERLVASPTSSRVKYADVLTASGSPDGGSNGSTTATSSTTVVKSAQNLIVSIRPYQLETGFGSANLELVSSIPIPVEPIPSGDGKRSFAIVQTDKPIYKPEDKVRIRSMVVNENLRPVVGDELRLQVKNPHKIIVEEVRFPNNQSEASAKALNHQNSDEPLFLDHIFEFPPEPMLGTWSVHLLHPDPIANDTTSFEVREYVLPTYEIEFETPRYILPSTQAIAGSIVAKYHHGKPVQGKAQFKFGIKESSTAKPKFIARSSIKTVDPQTGRVEYKINSNKFKETDWFPGIAGSRLVVEATVTEMSTGHREIAQDSSCHFISMPYKFSFEDSIEDFKPGLSQQLTVQVLEMQTQRPAPAGARIQAQYRDQNGTILNAASLAANNQPVDFRQILDSEAITDSDGRATFNVGPVRDDVTSIQVTLKWLSGDNSGTMQPQQDKSAIITTNELAVGHHSLRRHESQNGWISLMNKSETHLNVGDEFVSDLLIRDAVVIPQKIFYLIVSRGQILTLNTLSPDGLVKFTITETMVPSIRIVLFALTYDSVGLLSDSMKVNIGQDLSCGLSLKYKSHSNDTSDPNLTNHRPNDKGNLVIQARQGDLVSLIGVDAALYTLNNRTRLDSTRIVERIKRLDSGCGFGGGKDNLDVFYNAGLMFFKEVTNEPHNDLISSGSHIGTACLTVINQLKYLEDIQLGYSRPMFAAATQMNRPRMLELAAAVRHKQLASAAESRGGRHRTKREIDVDRILRRYKDPLYKACCRLGTLEDLPQRRNCSVRARIVEKYMQQDEFRSCASVYFDCCRAVFTDSLRVSSLMSSLKVSIEGRIAPSLSAAPQYSQPVLPNVGLLDKIESQTLIRKDFRETWLFDLVSVYEPDGSASLEVQLPHSITSWSIFAMALNRFQPMCLMRRPLRLTTFQEIFLHVSMPFKVIQGEQIDLIATVFNYSPLSQEVLVYMYGIADVCSEAEPGERSDRKRIRIDKHSSQSVLFPMIPLKTGKYPVKILAITPSSGRSDIVEKILNVVPRGKPVTDETTFSLDPLNQQRRSKRAIQTGNLVDEIDSSKGLQRSKVRLTPSRDSESIVPLTQECIVSAIGDKMGQSVQTTMIDVENLIRLPHGCGEQVMIYLGPTLYTTRYLSFINRLTGDLRWRAIRYIQSGYKRILNYRKENGAFSAFARRDASIWLTAFIAKMLCQTERTPFVAAEIHVDKTVVNSALNWLVDVQNKETGTWTELNPVYHREMLGGVLKENVLTAFVTVTLNECAHHSPDLVDETEIDSVGRESGQPQHAQTNAIDKLKVATQRAEQALLLDKYKAVKERNPYVLALTAYALSFSRPQEAASVLNDLIVFAERSQARNQLYWRGDYPIETAAYALQALIELAPIIVSQASDSSSRAGSWMPGADAQAIVNWLSTRRSYTGAFESTQDTVVALEALSKFAQLQSTPNGNSLIAQSPSSSSSLMCNVTISNRMKRSIEFGKENSQILQTFKLEAFDIDTINGEMLDIVTSGNGLGTMSVKLKYNVFQEEDDLCRFNIDSSIEEWQPPKSVLSPFKQSEQGTNDDLKDTSSAGDIQSNETIEDDYFKTFDKSMLSELNLVDLNHFDHHSNEHNSNNNSNHRDIDKHERQAVSSSQASRKPVLRLRRLAPQMMDLSSKQNESNEASTLDSWASKVVTSLRARLPSWLGAKPTSTTPAPLALATMSGIDNYMSDASFGPPSVPGYKKTNTSRRSPQIQNPVIVHPTGIPANVKLNTLSKRLELNQTNNQSYENGTSHNQQVGSNRLVLLFRVCVHHMSSRRDSEMAVIEVGILSGFKPNEADLKEIIEDVGTPAMKYEISADRSLVIIYMQYIPFSGPYCLQFRMIRDSFVSNLQSGYIRVFEYYSPAHSCSNFYTPTRVTDLIETKCDSSGIVCQCATKSLCPATNKLLDLGEIYSVNTTSARNQLIDLVCSNRFDFVSLVRLKSVRHLEAAKMFKLSVKVKSDLKGNLTKIIDAQRQQKVLNSIRKPPYASLTAPGADYGTSSSDKQRSNFGNDAATAPIALDTTTDEEETSLDYLNLSIDSSCIKNDPLLLHLAHPNQWKQGGELMILFGRFEKLEKRFFKIATKQSSSQLRTTTISQGGFPRPKPNTYSSGSLASAEASGLEKQEAQLEALFEDAQQLQYSTTMLFDKDSILHDLAYQAKVEPRQTINNLVLWLELRSRREKWTCPQQQVS